MTDDLDLAREALDEAGADRQGQRAAAWRRWTRVKDLPSRAPVDYLRFNDCGSRDLKP